MMTSGRVIGAAFLSTFVVHLFVYEGPVTGYWDTYIAAPALHLAGKAAGFYLDDGQPAYPHTHLIGKLPDDLVDRQPGGFGVITEDQRLGAAVIASPFYQVLGLFGFRAMEAAAWAIAAGLVSATAIAIGAPNWAALAAGLLLALNPYALSVNRLNANVVSLPALTAILWLVFAFEPTPDSVWGWGALIGLLLGALGGIRNECVLVVPAVAVAMWARLSNGSDRRRAFAATIAAAVVAIAPSLAWQQWAFGRMLIHASQFGGFEGFRPTFPHALGPFRFEFNGMLNWPFYDHLIRTPHFPYPTYVLLPLVIVRSFGLIAVALTLIGWLALGRRRPAVAVSVALWIAALWGMLSVQENWEELKMTYLVLVFPAAALPFAEALGWLSRSARSPSFRVVALGATVAGVWLAASALATVEVPVDPRWWQRFPHAAVNSAGFAELPHELRWSWEYFHSSESEAELARERARLVPPHFLPRSYRARPVDLGDETRKMGDELRTSELKTMAVWKYIYTPP